MEKVLEAIPHFLRKIRSSTPQICQLIVIDEAQHVPEIGLALKLLVDHFPGLRLIATGSASFTLAHQLGEPLVGRQWTKLLYPISQLELAQTHSTYELRDNLEKYLIFGGYPEVLTATTPKRKRQLLTSLSASYLLRDILALEKVKSSQTLVNLLRLLAYQIGSEVSLHELATQLKIDGKTVARYLDLLEKTFVIKALSPFYLNQRKAVAKKHRYYFLDLGIRNAIINNFNSLELRNDQGQLWENFLVVERWKKQLYQEQMVNNYFWRTYDQREVDWVEEAGGRLVGYEFKWSQAKSRHRASWQAAFPGARFTLVNQDNYLAFIN